MSPIPAQGRLEQVEMQSLQTKYFACMLGGFLVKAEKKRS